MAESDRNPLANMTSIRLKILGAMANSFSAMDAFHPPEDPYGITFGTVAIGPLMKADNRKRYSLGIVAGHEKEAFEMPFVMCFLTVNVEFRVTINSDDTAPGIMIEEALTVVKRKLTEDRGWGGLAIDTKVVNSEVDMITYGDRAPHGVCVAVVQYRYGQQDPRNDMPT
jgi:hypothetical protein